MNLECKCAHHYHPDSALTDLSGNILIDFRGMVDQLQQSQINEQVANELEKNYDLVWPTCAIANWS